MTSPSPSIADRSATANASLSVPSSAPDGTPIATDRARGPSRWDCILSWIVVVAGMVVVVGDGMVVVSAGTVELGIDGAPSRVVAGCKDASEACSATSGILQPMTTAASTASKTRGNRTEPPELMRQPRRDVPMQSSCSGTHLRRVWFSVCSDGLFPKWNPLTSTTAYATLERRGRTRPSL